MAWSGLPQGAGAQSYPERALRPLGVSTTRRTATLPDVPTIAEAGLPGYEVNGWYGILAPARTPQAVIKRLNDELAVVLRDSKIRHRLLGIGVEAEALGPAEFHALIDKDIKRWQAVVKRARVERL